MADQPAFLSARLKAFDFAHLTPIVRAALNRPELLVTSLDSSPLPGGFGGARNDTYMFRFHGTASDAQGEVEWSLIVKVLSARPGEAPTSTHYWKREAEAYRAHLLDDISGGLRCVQCFEVTEYPDESVWLWMEEIHDALPSQWPIAHYEVIGRQFGRFQGAYVTGKPLPSAPWLSQDWLRQISHVFGDALPRLRATVALPALAAAYGTSASDQLASLWEMRHSFLNALDQLPQTLCHLDSFRRNLLTARNNHGALETVVIDWNFVGPAAIGVEMAVCLGVGLFLFDIASSDIEMVEQLLMRGYLAGLADAGWQGDARLVRLGFCAAFVAKHYEMLTILDLLGTEDGIAFLVGWSGLTAQQVIQHYADIFHYVLRMRDEAIGLIRDLS